MLFKKTWTIMILKAAALQVVTAYAFYRSPWALIWLTPAAMFYVRLQIKEEKKRRNKAFNVQLRDGLNILYTHVKSGKSLIRAFESARDDLGIIYTQDAPIIGYFNRICRQENVNIPIEEAIRLESERTGDKDAIRFSRIIYSAKATGGNMSSIILKSARAIAEKITTEAEIETQIAAKKKEFFIMTLAPILVIGYMSVFSGSIMGALYSTAGGRIAATASLVLYGTAVVIGRKITDVRTIWQ